MRMNVGFFRILPGLAMCAALAGGCGGGGGAETNEPEPRLVQAVTAAYDSLKVTVNAWGMAEPNRRVELAFEVQGTVDALPYDEGERASKGSVLGVLRQGRFKSSHASARASYEDAERNLRRMKTLSEEDVVSNEERERAEILLAAAEARLSGAEEDLRGSVIAAPFSGLVTKRYCELGEVTSPGKPAFVFMEMDPILVVIDLSDTDVSRVEVGQPSVVHLDPHPGVAFEGRISSVAVAADEQGGAFEVEIEIPNPDLLIKPGMAAEVEITVNRLPRSIVLPIEAIIYEAGVPFVYVVSDGRAEKRELNVEAQAGMTVAVRGIAAGDTIVAAGNRFLKDGEPVRVAIAQ